MSGVFFSPAAVGDLQEIYDYIAADNAPAAETLLVDVQQAGESLVRHPRLGVGREDLLPGLRLIVIRKVYVAFYRINGPEIEVVRIVHGRRDFSMLFDL